MDSLIIFCGKYLVFFVFLLATYTFYRTKKRREFALAVLFAIVIAVVFSKVANALYFDPRPFVTENIKPLIAHGPDNGFPSEHTIAAMTLTTVIYYYRKKFAAWAAAMTLLVGLGRMFAHVHSAIDVIAGIAIGVIAGWAGHQIAKMISKRYSK